jgi:hypothetical protein
MEEFLNMYHHINYKGLVDGELKNGKRREKKTITNCTILEICTPQLSCA